MGYADLTAVRQILALEQSLAADQDAADARLEALDDALSAVFDSKVGRRWGAAGPATRVVWPGPGRGESLLLPDGGITSLTSVAVDPTWNGTSWVNATAVPAAEVLPWDRTADGRWLSLRLAVGWRWRGPALVTAAWADMATAPADVVEALTFVVAEEYKQERASPEAMIGPDGLQVSTRNPWRFERVAAVIAAHKVWVL